VLPTPTPTPVATPTPTPTPVATSTPTPTPTPLTFEAYSDHKQMMERETTVLDVTDNDIIPEDTNATVIFRIEDENYQILFVTEQNNTSGNWKIINNKITFTPNATFGGHNARTYYRLFGEDGSDSYANVNINYPIELYARGHQVIEEQIQETIVNVSENSIIIDGSEGTVLLKYYDENATIRYGTEYESYYGNFLIVDNDIQFTPNNNFEGGSVYMDYQLSDDNGHTSEAWISIEFPIIIQAQY
jgi:hypothetical protein